MREYIVCYTLENEIKREKIIMDPTMKKEQVLQEILEKMEKNKSLSVKGPHGEVQIDSSLIRYLHVRENNQSKHTIIPL